jgi:hypothetical protein
MAKITWTDKTALNPQPSIARENKVIDDDMNEIKQVVNTNDDNVGDLTNLDTTDKSSIVNAINEVLDGDVYSTNEIKTNKVWIDGKPIYRKVIETTSPSSTNSWTVIGSISNLDTIINLYGWVKASNKRILPIQYSEPGAEIATTVLNGNIEMKVILSNWQSATCYMVAEYTKTTD